MTTHVFSLFIFAEEKIHSYKWIVSCDPSPLKNAWPGREPQTMSGLLSGICRPVAVVPARRAGGKELSAGQARLLRGSVRRPEGLAAGRGVQGGNMGTCKEFHRNRHCPGSEFFHRR